MSDTDYCLSKADPSNLKVEVDKYIILNKPNEIWYPRTDKIYLQKDKQKYSIKIHRGLVQLTDEKKGSVIYQIELPYEKDSNVSSGYSTEDNWLYINADKNNYAVKIDLSNSDSQLKYDILPKIYPEQCNRFTNWFDGGCSVEHFKTFSSSNKVFLTGHELKSGKRKWVVMEILEGKPKIIETTEQIKSIFYIPESSSFILKGVKGKIFLYNDIGVEEIETPQPVDRVLQYTSHLNGILLQGTKGAVLFYDGTNVKEIPSPFPRQHRGARDWYVAKIATFEGDDWNNYEERIFLYNPGRKTPYFFMELKANLLLEPVSFPEEINEMKIDLFRFPNDSLLWAMTNDGNIIAEINGKFQNIITISESHYLKWDDSLTIPIKFEVGQVSGKKRETFYLKKASSSSQCDVLLDTEKTLLLKPE